MDYIQQELFPAEIKQAPAEVGQEDRKAIALRKIKLCQRHLDDLLIMYPEGKCRQRITQIGSKFIILKNNVEQYAH